MSDVLTLAHTHYTGIESHDVELALSPFAADVSVELPSGPLEGVEALRAVVQGFITAFPDLKLSVRNSWEVDRAVIVEVDFHGTHTGPLPTAQGDVGPTGRTLSFPLVDIFVTGDDGKVVEHRVYWDNASFLAQLGLMPDTEA